MQHRKCPLFFHVALMHCLVVYEKLQVRSDLEVNMVSPLLKIQITMPALIACQPLLVWTALNSAPVPE